MDEKILKITLEKDYDKLAKILEYLEPYAQKEKCFVTVKEIGDEITCRLKLSDYPDQLLFYLFIS